VRGYLIDTHILSELRKGPRADSGVRAWYEAVDEKELFLSVLVLGEIRRGIELRRLKDAAAARTLDQWLHGLELGYGSRLLPVTPEISDRWGRLSIRQPLPPIDGLLAATALHHGLTLVTRNEEDVARSGVAYLNPFEN